MKLTGKPELVNLIKKKIKQEGAISFRDFMDMALYYPELGYYTSKKDKIGGYGDFFTSSEVDKAFGQLLAEQFSDIYLKLKANNFKIVEIGAGKGYLASDILSHLKNTYQDIYENIEYIIIEKSPYHVQIQKEILKEHKNVKWVQGLTDFEDESIEGVIFSNELFDSFPVHVIRKKNSKIYEIYITIDSQDNVIELEREPSKEILDYMKELHIDIPEGMTTEINLDAKDMIQLIGKKLKKGFVFTIDYGYPSKELYKPYRMRGTLLCYHKHQYSENYYENVGLQDITSHVNFSALKHFGEKVGLKTLGFTDQAHFLTSLGLMDIIGELQARDDFASYERLNRLKTLVLPKGMGEKFKVLVQYKNLENPQIRGLEIMPYQSDRFRL